MRYKKLDSVNNHCNKTQPPETLATAVIHRDTLTHKILINYLQLRWTFGENPQGNQQKETVRNDTSRSGTDTEKNRLEVIVGNRLRCFGCMK